jgi:hypothetical protein
MSSFEKLLDTNTSFLVAFNKAQSKSLRVSPEPADYIKVLEDRIEFLERQVKSLKQVNEKFQKMIIKLVEEQKK